MQVLVVDSEADAAVKAADTVAEVLRANLYAKIGLATGSTMTGVYRSLVERHRSGLLSFARAEVYLLDEYIGLDAGHPQAYRNVIRRSLTDLVGLKADAVFGPDGNAPDLDAEARRYEGLVRSAGIDIQLLGIGGNGHIAFNEPGAPLDGETSVVVLTEATRRDNARFFDTADDVPRRAITQGIGTILGAKQIVLVAQGMHKAHSVRAALEGPVCPDVPASAIRLHPQATMVLDAEAARLLKSGC